MLTLSEFNGGLNNVLPSSRLPKNQLSQALNVDIGLSGEVQRRQGYSLLHARSHRNLWAAAGYLLATVEGDLTVIEPTGAHRLLQAGLGDEPLSYCSLPDGRTAFVKATHSGITDGIQVTPWGVPIPTALGLVTSVTGDLLPGTYRYALTYVRLSDGLEGEPLYSDPVELPEGGLVITGLPTQEGYAINLYLSSQHGGVVYLAASTSGAAVSFIGKNELLVLPLKSDHEPAPSGHLCAFWRTRALIASDQLLYASKPYQVEAFETRRDFKHFDAPIQLLHPVEGGIYVGTAQQLLFLSGTDFDHLTCRPVFHGRVISGSGVTVPGEWIGVSSGVGQGVAMICIAGQDLLACFGDGSVVPLTQGRYQVQAERVAATFRLQNGIPQYLAIPQ